MSQSSTITNAFVIPGVSLSETGWSLLVGLVADDQKIGWGRCWYDSAESDEPIELNDGIHIFQEIIIPALLGQPLSNLVGLMEMIDGMGREVTLVRPITAESPQKKRSRRELFTSILSPVDEIHEVVERPIPPQLRYGVSQALVVVAAAVDGVSVVEVVGRTYGLETAEAPLPIHLIFDDLPNPKDLALARISAASYGLTVDNGEVVKALGKDGVRLQNRVRQLKNRAVRNMGDDGSFMFDLAGGYGALYGEKNGAILGALFGLEQVVKPYGLRLVDPIIEADRPSQIERMKELQSYLRMRKMRTKLVARAWIETAADVDAFADENCCQGVWLDMAHLGTINRTAELVRVARARGLEVILSGAQSNATVHTALALNPKLLVVGIDEMSEVIDEVNRALAWHGFNIKNK